jgi:hypothetical protein
LLFIIHGSLVVEKTLILSTRREKRLCIADLGIEIFEQHIPHSNDVADASCKNEEVEHRVHVFCFVQRIEHCSGYVAHTFGNYPHEGGSGNGVDKWFESHQHAKSHAYEAQCLEIGMFLQMDEAHDGAHNGTQPYKREKAPSPIAFVAKGYER